MSNMQTENWLWIISIKSSKYSTNIELDFDLLFWFEFDEFKFKFKFEFWFARALLFLLIKLELSFFLLKRSKQFLIDVFSFHINNVSYFKANNYYRFDLIDLFEIDHLVYLDNYFSFYHDLERFRNLLKIDLNQNSCQLKFD